MDNGRTKRKTDIERYARVEERLWNAQQRFLDSGRRLCEMPIRIEEVEAGDFIGGVEKAIIFSSSFYNSPDYKKCCDMNTIDFLEYYASKVERICPDGNVVRCGTEGTVKV